MLKAFPAGAIPASALWRVRRFGPVGKVIAVGLCVIGLILIVTTSFAFRRYRAELADAAREMRTLDLLLANDTGRSLESVSLVLDALTDQLQRIAPGEINGDRVASIDMHEALRARTAGLPQLDALSVVAADGKLLNFSRIWPVPPIRLDDRDYFRMLRDGASSQPYLTEPVLNRGTGTRTIYLAKRRNGPDGRFEGAVLGAIALDYFQNLYASLLLDPGNRVTLRRDDGTVLASYPGSVLPVAERPSIDAATSGVDGVSRMGWAPGHGVAARLVASQKVEGFPIRIDVERSKAMVLKDWRREVTAIGTFVLLAVASIVAMMWSLVRRFRAYEAVTAAAVERERAILARQEAEDALRQAQKMEAVGQLTGGVAHDFNNLLTVIGSSVELLRRNVGDPARRSRYVEAISDASARAAKLTGQLLAFSRRQALCPETFDVAENVRSVGQMIDRLTGARVEIVLDLPGEPCHVHADPNQFDTAIVNLAVNARDAMPDGGRLQIVVRQVAALSLGSGTVAHDGPFVSVAVTDNGVGIAQALQDRVFEPFFTTKGVGQGTGLGLSQVIGFTRQSGGDVSLRSCPGQGSTFTLNLPLVAGVATGSRPKGEFASVANGKGARILVVDDDRDVAQLTAQLLRELKYFSVIVSDAEEALDLLDDDEAGFAAVLSDVVMPGMGGVTLARAIRGSHPSLPVLLMTGYSATLAEQGAVDVGVLRKPFGIEQLAHALHDAIDGRWLAADAAQSGRAAPSLQARVGP